MFIYLRLNQLLAKYCTNTDREIIANAFLFGANAHEEQMRSSGDPYFTHPTAVAYTLAEMRLDTDTIIGALLHDVVEDTNITSEEISQSFGEAPAKLVKGMTKLAKIKFRSKEEAQAENFRKMILAMVEDIRVIIIKLADRLHNMGTLGSLAPEKKRRVAQETLEIYAPIAHRLGMHHFKNEFQDLAFEAIYPYRHKTLQARVNQAHGHRKRLFDKLKNSLITHFTTEQIPPERISGREKRLYSIYQKMLRRSTPLSEIMDVYAFRIIATSERQCYNILGGVHALYKPIPGRFKDYIAIPKANGYQSLHTTLFGPYGIPIEIQIRTKEMDYTADKGIAAHWVYKSDNANQQRTRRWLKKLSAIQSHSSTSLDFIQNVKVDLFPDEVYVFTPLGDIRELPAGATTIDFAYSIHTQVGNQCIAARVNRRLVPLSQKLNHGETVEILTSPTATPSPSWLNFVTTNKAKHGIRIYIRDQENEQAISLGRKLLHNLLKLKKINIDTTPDNILLLVLQEYSANDLNQVLSMVGRGDLDSIQVANSVIHSYKALKTEIHTENDSHEPAKHHIDSITNLATCCCPIPGDLIIGVMTPGTGIEVHTTKCHILQNGQFLEKKNHLITHISWPERSNEYFSCALMIDVKNYQGAIADIAAKIARKKASILQINVQDAHNSHGSLYVLIDVLHRTHLAHIIKSLRNINSVYKVSRFFDSRQKSTTQHHIK
jgi:GTP diphosphokinase / guanosine-3',5'-bis(diphosphate) 3'-diphosphatase